MIQRITLAAVVVAAGLFWSTGTASAQSFHNYGYMPYPNGVFPQPANFGVQIYRQPTLNYGYSYGSSYNSFYAPTPYLYVQPRLYTAPVYRYDTFRYNNYNRIRPYRHFR